MTAYVSEWTGPGEAGTSQVPYGALPPLVSQQIAPGSSGNAFSANTRFILVVSDAAVLLAIGAAPTATNSVYVPANVPMYLAVAPGDTLFTAAPS